MILLPAQISAPRFSTFNIMLQSVHCASDHFSPTNFSESRASSLPPGMDISDYRREFAEFNSAFELAQYDYRAGFEPELRSRQIYERYSDLFTREAVYDLARAEESLPAHLETERASLHALNGAARIGYLEAQ